jgi:hypothetical protein
VYRLLLVARRSDRGRAGRRARAAPVVAATLLFLLMVSAPAPSPTGTGPAGRGPRRADRKTMLDQALASMADGMLLCDANDRVVV